MYALVFWQDEANFHSDEWRLHICLVYAECSWSEQLLAGSLKSNVMKSKVSVWTDAMIL